MNEMKDILGAKISQYIKDNNLSQKEFLEIIRKKGLTISPSALHFWIQGQKEPRGEAKNILFDILGMSVSQDIIESKLQRIPLLADVHCGNPTFTEQKLDVNVVTNYNLKADFCVKAKGDSMSPLIENGDIVFIKKQIEANNNDVIVVSIDDEYCIRRFYKEKDVVTLVAENKMYQPIIITKESNKEIRIIGKAIYSQFIIV